MNRRRKVLHEGVVNAAFYDQFKNPAVLKKTGRVFMLSDTPGAVPLTSEMPANRR